MYWLGLDFGTSGARAIAIDLDGASVAEARCDYPQTGNLAEDWKTALGQLLTMLPFIVRQQLQGIAIDGTSGTGLLCDRTGHPLTAPLLYNDDRGQSALAAVQAVIPESSPAGSATSTLAKALWWHQQLPMTVKQSARYLLHQADWLSYCLHGQLGITDYHNALKLGYDLKVLAYPDWLRALPIAPWLPQVHCPGSPVAAIHPDVAALYDLPVSCFVKAGTTDSIAAFLASDAKLPGEAVTSLGSTLVLKLLSPVQIEDAKTGIYSHRLGNLWLVGGASNTGGAVLRQFFSDQQLLTLSAQIRPEKLTHLNYYPLTQPGERFPICDPQYPPQITPRPQDPVIFLQGLLEGIAQIEALGYQALTRLGAPAVKQVYTAGGGATNEPWRQIRRHYLGVPVSASKHLEAAYGAARLAQSSDLKREDRGNPDRFNQHF